MLISTPRVVAKRFAFCSKCRCRFYSKNIIKEGDTVLLKNKRGNDAVPILTRPLKAKGSPINIRRSLVEQADLIGRPILDIITTKRDLWRIHQPTLAEYVTLSPRLVTPIYPADANLIISLLDLHPATIREDDDENAPLEIFEAGTGHGSLTLYLARAIDGANPPAPPPPSIKSHAGSPKCDALDVEIESHVPNQEITPAVEEPSPSPVSKVAKENFEAYEAYLLTRRAIIHTLDISPRHSKQAQRTVRNFRRGMYYHNVDFHVDTIPSYLSARLESSPSPFLEHAILDLPDCHNFLETVNQALKRNGTVIVFCPSITQINTCIQLVKKRLLPWMLETTLELGVNAGVGGREWDVRFTKPRAVLKAELEGQKKQREEQEQQGSMPEAENVDEGEGPNAEITIDENVNESLNMVCRPKVGGKIAGGGFLTQWRKLW